MGEQATTASTGGLDPAGWVASHGEAMFAYARLRLPTAEAAEEVVQEALLAAFRSRGSFDGRSSERTWLIGVLRHKVLDALRATKKAPFQLDDKEETCFCKGEYAEPMRTWPDSVGLKEVQESVRAALDRLPEAMRRALVLRELDGLPGKAVCEILDISPTNLWTLVHRGKARLRKMLSEEFASTGDRG
ncbi:MAG: sigma-70 family RNA polymerase sigma factor [Phycisphaeraceae bacterium]|nr:MAG: sigma-70 family RNA polymerase sigma factor [Phycisphaeraceae bacterium]